MEYLHFKIHQQTKVQLIIVFKKIFNNQMKSKRQQFRILIIIYY